MIDINELRRLAQAAMHPVTKGRWMRLFGERTVYDRMEDGCRGIPVVSTPFSPPPPFEAACLDFIAAANPAAVIELLDRLEAAEKERDSGRKIADSLALALNTSNHERDNLCTKLAGMEQQKPVAWLHESRRDSDVVTDAVKHVWGRVAVGSMAAYSIPLYALPGAQARPAPSELVVTPKMEEAFHEKVEVTTVGSIRGLADGIKAALLAAAPEIKP